MNKRLYALHRWISAVALLQLAVWVTSGFFFAIVPMARVKGTPVDGANTAPLSPSDALVPPSVILAKLAERGAVSKLELVGTPAGVFYRGKVGVARFRFDARTGEERVTSDAEAGAVAMHDQPGMPSVRRVDRIDHDTSFEYRGRPLPAFRVELEDGSGTVVYVDAVTAEVTARRNSVWRVYDFLWSLHIMDYTERERFHHPLLVIAAGLGVLTVVSGAGLWLTRILRWRRRRVETSERKGRQSSAEPK